MEDKRTKVELVKYFEGIIASQKATISQLRCDLDSCDGSRILFKARVEELSAELRALKAAASTAHRFLSKVNIVFTDGSMKQVELKSINTNDPRVLHLTRPNGAKVHINMDKVKLVEDMYAD